MTNPGNLGVRDCRRQVLQVAFSCKFSLSSFISYPLARAPLLLPVRDFSQVVVMSLYSDNEDDGFRPDRVRDSNASDQVSSPVASSPSRKESQEPWKSGNCVRILGEFWDYG